MEEGRSVVRWVTFDVEVILCDAGYGGDGRAGRNGQGGLGMNSVMGLSLMDELSPRSSKILRHQTVAKEGFLWKQGHRLKSWKQRWYDRCPLLLGIGVIKKGVILLIPPPSLQLSK